MAGINRFSPREELDWDESAYSAGIEAQHKGAPLEVNPFPEGSWQWKSFRAGWADADMISGEIRGE